MDEDRYSNPYSKIGNVDFGEKLGVEGAPEKVRNYQEEMADVLARQREIELIKAKHKKQGPEAIEAKLKQTADLVAKIKKIKFGWRAFNIASGITVYGLILTFISMNVQLIMSGVEGIALFKGIGSNFGIKMVPALSIGEFLILALLWFVILLLILFIVLLVVIGAKCGTGYQAGAGVVGDITGINWSECAKLLNSAD